MNVLEKILEEIEEKTIIVATSKEHYNQPQNGEFVEEVITIKNAENIIRSHMVEKERVTSAKIISREIDGKPYYEIKFKKVGEDEYTVGYSSYKFDYVVKWLNDCFEFCEEAKVSCYNDGWIPVEDTEHTPENESYVLVSFSNFTLPDIARYEENEEGGTYYPGDDEESYLKYGLFVNAWQPLPKPYHSDPCHDCFGAANNDCQTCGYGGTE